MACYSETPSFVGFINGQFHDFESLMTYAVANNFTEHAHVKNRLNLLQCLPLLLEDSFEIRAIGEFAKRNHLMWNVYLQERLRVIYKVQNEMKNLQSVEAVYKLANTHKLMENVVVKSRIQELLSNEIPDDEMCEEVDMLFSQSVVNDLTHEDVHMQEVTHPDFDTVLQEMKNDFEEKEIKTTVYICFECNQEFNQRFRLRQHISKCKRGKAYSSYTLIHLYMCTHLL